MKEDNKTKHAQLSQTIRSHLRFNKRQVNKRTIRAAVAQVGQSAGSGVRGVRDSGFRRAHNAVSLPIG